MIADRLSQLQLSFLYIHSRQCVTSCSACCVVLDAVMRDHFGQFGTVQDVRVFKDKGFSFIKYVVECVCLFTCYIVSVSPSWS